MRVTTQIRLVESLLWFLTAVLCLLAIVAIGLSIPFWLWLRK